VNTTVLFGHWSTLGRLYWPEYSVYGLDTGCVWGRQLSALRLEDRSLHSVQSRQRGSD
jgi:bis(5'-nucleosyl)-tetraphosphatase (symmetrical)